MYRPIGYLIGLVALAGLLAGCGNGSVGNKTGGNPITLPLPEEPPPTCHLDIPARLAAGQGYCYETGFLTHDGIEIAMQVFVPQPEKLRTLAGMSPDSDEPGYAPLIVHSHGFGGNKAEDFSPPGTELDRQVALDLWQSGYWVISFTQRGFGGIDGSERASGGQIGLMSPDNEGWDFVRLVDWAICHLRENAPLEQATAMEDADPEFGNCGQDSGWGRSLLATDGYQRLSDFDDDVALGTVGYSYGGAFQFNAQSVDPRVDAILPMGTWHDLRTSLHPNDAPKTAWITVMTAFSSSVPGVGGGNGEPLPAVLVEANSEANGANQDVNDTPYNKSRQVSVRNFNTLAPNGAVAYCDGHAEAYGQKFADPDNEPHDLTAANRPAHAVAQRMPRADLFMIQGYGDTLFPMGEGYDNARCFEDAGLDVYYLGETSGHPLAEVGPPHYAGVNGSMYLDEIVHCGVDTNDQPRRYNTRELGKQWFDAKLRGAFDFADVFPNKVCITQTNADTALVLDTNDDFFDNGTTNDGATAYQWSREGAVFDAVAQVPVGGVDFDVPPTTLTTGTGSLGQGLDTDPRVVFVALSTLQSPQVMAGIPTANLSVSRANPAADEIFFAGIAVKRCQPRPQPDQDPADCADSAPELLHFQAMPIRIFPNDAVGLAQDYPRDDPRNFDGQAKGNFYPLRWGDNPQDPSLGRLHGVTARLYPGDQVGLLLMPEHPAFTSIFSPVPGQLTISGTVGLPFVEQPTPPPTQVPAYVIDGS